MIVSTTKREIFHFILSEAKSVILHVGEFILVNGLSLLDARESNGERDCGLRKFREGEGLLRKSATK